MFESSLANWLLDSMVYLMTARQFGFFGTLTDTNVIPEASFSIPKHFCTFKKLQLLIHCDCGHSFHKDNKNLQEVDVSSQVCSWIVLITDWRCTLTKNFKTCRSGCWEGCTALLSHFNPAIGFQTIIKNCYLGHYGHNTIPFWLKSVWVYLCSDIISVTLTTLDAIVFFRYYSVNSCKIYNLQFRS